MKRISTLVCLLLVAGAAFAQNAQQQFNQNFISGSQCVTVPSSGYVTGSYSISGTWTGTITVYGVVGQGSAVALASQTANGSFTQGIAGYTLFEACGNTVATGAAFVQVYSMISGSGNAGINTGTANQFAIYTGPSVIGPDVNVTDANGTFTYTGANGNASPAYTANGAGAGNLAVGQGITVPGALMPANSFNLSGQNSITTYQVVVPSASAAGLWTNTIASPATLTAGMSGNQLTSVTINSGGGSPNPYAVAPSVQVTGGSCVVEPAVTLSISAGVVNGYTIANPGSGCTGTPALNVVPQAVLSYSANPALGGATSFINLTAAGNGSHIKTAASTHDISGVCQMASGACSTISFTTAYTTQPACTVTWDGITGTLTGILSSHSTTSGLTPTSSVGTDTAKVHYICFGDPN